MMKETQFYRGKFKHAANAFFSSNTYRTVTSRGWEMIGKETSLEPEKHFLSETLAKPEDL